MFRRDLLCSIAVLALLSACLPESNSESLPDPAPDPDPESGDVLGTGDELVVYSGRTEDLIAPLIAEFEEQTGVDVAVRYGETAQMAATILEEGANSPADIFLAQDAGALGAVAEAGMFAPLPADLLDLVDARFRSRDGTWIGISGRARVVAYNVSQVDRSELPDSILDFVDPAWHGRIGWAPTNGSFQAFVTALRIIEGEDATREWLEGIVANEAVAYPNNSVALEAVASGEVDVAFINHYYLYRALEEHGGDFNAAIYFLPGGDPGALVNVAGAGALATSDKIEHAQLFIRFLLSSEAQHYFSEETYEYPLVAGIAADPRLPPLEDIQTPDIDLNALSDLAATLELLQAVGALE